MPNQTDTQALNDVAEILGSADNWDRPIALLDHISEVVSGTGRPHPCAYTVGNSYSTALRDWSTNRPSEEPT